MCVWSLLHRLSGLDTIFVIFERQTFRREDWELCNGRRERQNILPSERGEWGVGRLASHIATQARHVPPLLTTVPDTRLPLFTRVRTKKINYEKYTEN